MTKTDQKEKLMAAGGQAVIEGVMMRSNKNIAIAVRKPSGRITVKKQKFHSLGEKYKILRLPFIRGVVNMLEMMVVGVKALNYSANESIEEEEEKLSGWAIAGSIVLSMTFAILIFKFIPLLIAHFASKMVEVVQGSYLMFNVINGVSKIGLFIGYIWLIALMGDVRRVLQYHGAEHKAVHCYEGRKSLTPKNADNYTTLHPRCGTSFILYVLVISVGVYMFIPQTWVFWQKLLAQIGLLPVVAGISYEFLRFSARHRENKLMKACIAPGLLMQKLTTRKPSKNMLGVSCTALKTVLGLK
jgi:uncharacterized protein YqhQ